MILLLTGFFYDHIKNSTKYFTKCGVSQTSIMPQKLLCRSLFYQTKAEQNFKFFPQGAMDKTEGGDPVSHSS